MITKDQIKEIAFKYTKEENFFEFEPNDFYNCIKEIIIANKDNSVKDHELRNIINQLRDIAIEFHDTQQLRARIASTLIPLFK